jgi:hypothetical protein
MDSKGAQELLRLLESRHGKMPEAPPVDPLQEASAAPIYHWLGIEPPPSQSEGDES